MLQPSDEVQAKGKKVVFAEFEPSNAVVFKLGFEEP
jgi:hypothetical protein